MKPASKLLHSLAEITLHTEACPLICSGVQAHSFQQIWPFSPFVTRLYGVQPDASPASATPSSLPQHMHTAASNVQQHQSPAAQTTSQKHENLIPPLSISSKRNPPLPTLLDNPPIVASEVRDSPLAMDRYKFPYAVMRSAIYENDIHMEHVGELAKFVKIRRAQSWYSNNIESYRTLAVLLGGITRGKMVRYLERAKRARLADRRWAFMSLLESRLDMTLLRTGLTHNIRMAQGWTRHNKLTVNGEKVNRVAHEVRPGDVIAVAPARRQEVVNRLTEDLHEFFWEVHGTPAWRPVYYGRTLKVDDRPGVPVERYHLGLGNLMRKLVQRAHYIQDAKELTKDVMQPDSKFSAGRKKSNDLHHPWRVDIREAAAMGSSPAAVDEQLRRSFRVMLHRRGAQAQA